MNKEQATTIGVRVKLDIDETTANVCLMLLEMYCNAKNLRITEGRSEDGIYLLFRSRRTDND